MNRTDTVVVGAGQAGLALSRCLSAAERDHVVLERGRVAERWRSERWDSFRLLTPNWQTRLPGFRYRGDDPDGFMGRDDVVGFFDGYARSFDAPVESGVAVRRVAPAGDRWRVETSTGTYDARAVVIATGHYSRPATPAVAADLPQTVHQTFARDYRRPDGLPAGGVLVVGAGPSGQQIADELARAGRRVFLAVGRHRPLPRSYRGHDAYWWLDRTGALARTIDAEQHPHREITAPSVVLSGERRDLHLRRLARHGVVPVGHLVDVEGTRLRFADDLAGSLYAADANVSRFRAQVDDYVAASGLAVPVDYVPPPVVPGWATTAPTTLDLTAEGITSVLWAAGYRRDYSWVDAPVFDATGEPIQRRGVTAAPGLMFLGLRYMHRRNSNFIDGVGADAAHLATHLTGRETQALDLAVA
jgi:putative flavoprotein involved in K+ transport